MTNENKLKAIAKELDQFVKDTDYLKNKDIDMDKDVVLELKAQRSLALHLLIHFHLEENLD